MTTRRRTRRKGPQPTPKLVRQMRDRGYALVSHLAERYGLPPTTIYSWAQEGRLISPDKRPASVKHMSNLWVLDDAVKAKTTIPAETAS